MTGKTDLLPQDFIDEPEYHEMKVFSFSQVPKPSSGELIFHYAQAPKNNLMLADFDGILI